MFFDADVTDDGFLGGRLQILQPRVGYRAATDPVFLAAAVPALPGQTVLELGCGAGVASLCLAARVSELRVVGVEVQPSYADLARRNAVRNSIDIEVFEADLAAMPPNLRARNFDHVIANPPYYPAGDGTAAEDAGREMALREATPLAVWIDVATRRLKPGGRLTVIHLAERLPELLAACDDRLGSIRILPLAPRIGRPANRVILSAAKGARGPFQLLSPLVLHEGAAHDGDRDSLCPEVQAILRDGAMLEWRAR
ncbi:MAG: methyltransferase [Paracoccaceae bacterium]|nr:methyltransferase [Paracoccaceae bacterium]